MERLRCFCYDVYVKLRMNGPMFYCNYAREKDNQFFSELEKLCAEALQSATAGGGLWLTFQAGAYGDLQSYRFHGRRRITPTLHI